ncbi:diiron oxygenase [Tsukamurella sp. 8F]|uniref:AurF N-oxygenase family protein n=1 Tax=unclassified Tsukamurella TaxID=2633480 RepID=UPI0023BA22E8|nr:MULTISPECIES: diiron oxygenase [unclassified Tsukamurella]MDF0529029.1 diiron oxygenase [Tsukamurella sp. 8J]MDF0587402.1 diiron oxygenase [Tsukamurella sp. 8F]
MSHEDGRSPEDGRSREDVAGRLLGGSVRRSYAPAVDIDWEAPLEEDKWFLPPQMCTLYGTDIWESMSREQQVELSRQELVNLLSMGVWFENLLNRMLLRNLLSADPTSRDSHYSLTEMGDECRHMVMFGRVIDRIGARPFRLRGWQLGVVKYLLPLLIRGDAVWVFALVGEEIFDAQQRKIHQDPQLQPIVARLMQIHVTEEARHIGYARDAAKRGMATRSRRQTFVAGNLHFAAALGFRYLFANPRMYARVGLDPRAAYRAAVTNPNHIAAKHDGFRGLGKFLESVGLMGPIARVAWRRAGFWA